MNTMTEMMSSISAISGELQTAVNNVRNGLDGMVHVVLEKTEDSIQAIQKGTGVVTDTDESFRQIFLNMTDIQNAINTVNGTMQVLEEVATDMAATTQQQTASSEVVLQTCEQIMDISKEFKEDGKAMVQVGNDLQGLSDTLKEQVDQFKI